MIKIIQTAGGYMIVYNPSDNRIENLKIMSRKEHSSYHSSIRHSRGVVSLLK